MSASLLLIELKQFLENVFEHVGVGDDNESLKIHLGWLPQTKAPSPGSGPAKQPDSDFPYLIIRALDGVEEEDNGKVTIRMLVGVQAKEENGYVEILSLIEKTKQALLKTGIIGGKFEIERPVKWKLFEEQPYPEWVGEILTTWTVPAILREVVFD
ncbi:hypothetical protein ABNB59_19670 [Paenibacillus larvae]|uniref:Uncharacterized protein n=2 Tax=root TaxID=1 RepID=A0A0C5AN06_9CAUD|nr:hypothetical protein [Paenibacillus larvae]YP_009202217.1 virion structural protein [Bacteriophage Lily]AJK27735.1 hypothetical protein LILY_11 [Bacteriophage Lily]MCY9564612.1 hypothetical protein [Paenibacillus larvae]MCY9568342.1 hypothetical protein [Paenibacillus larvae]MCY9571682.1 hypothetical protein [Paenibacillus larvae]MCY9690986.1 hypothetical protein [Paenibacillus larvae]